LTSTAPPGRSVAQLLARIQTLLTGVEAVLAVSGLVLMLVLAMTQLIARNFFDTGFPLADTLLRYLVLLVSLLGAALAVGQRRHIKIDVLLIFVPQSWKRWLDLVFSVLSAVVCGVLCWAAARFWQMGWQFAPATGKWTAVLALILPLSFGLLALEFALRACFAVFAPEEER
jgi:TRAP-type C4-dicarboxylate transport system permease small subunit